MDAGSALAEVSMLSLNPRYKPLTKTQNKAR